MNFWKRIAVTLPTAALLGAVLAVLTPSANFWLSLLAYGLVLWVSLFCLGSAWQFNGGGRALGLLIVLAFGLRLVLGVGLSLALPVAGYNQPGQKAGYLFYDAFRRDQTAWDLAKSDKSLLSSFTEEFKTDQYGGLLALSAGLYRLVSPDAHRPWLVILAGAFLFALGVPFFYQALKTRWNSQIAALAAWIVVLYPDSLFFTASQMREPFMLGLTCLAFWAVVTWRNNWKRALLIFLLSFAGMLLISTRVTAAVLGVLLVWFWLDEIIPRWEVRNQIWGWIALLGGTLLLVAASAQWLYSSAWWDMNVTVENSGFLKTIIGQAADGIRIPIIVMYGLTQPVLPAAIAEPSIALWKTIVLLRSIGWYGFVPILLYGLAGVWRVKPARERRIFIWLLVVVFLWMVVASARGGGDLTDNPRYRTLFLPWMALLAAWGWQIFREHKDAWLWRVLAIEGIFLVFFTHMYLSRYFKLWAKLPFWTNVICIVALSAAIVIGGLVWDFLLPRMRHKNPINER